MQPLRPRSRSTATVRPLDVLILARSQFWPVSWMSLWLGFVLATHRLVPAPADLGSVALAAVITGPLVWLAVLAANDAYDPEGDRLKGRAGADVAVNGIAIGVLGPLGGWVLSTGSLVGFPWPIVLLGWPHRLRRRSLRNAW